MSSTTKITLTGSTWGHERGYGPLIKLNEERNSIFAASVDWKIRSLKEFGDHSLEDLAEELGVSYKELFVTIKPINEEFKFLLHLYKIENGKPILMREVPLKEITG